MVRVPIVFFAEPTWFAVFLAVIGLFIVLWVIKLVASALKLLLISGLFGV